MESIFLEVFYCNEWRPLMAYHDTPDNLQEARQFMADLKAQGSNFRYRIRRTSPNDIYPL